MDSRKIAQMNLFPGQEWRCRRIEWTYAHAFSYAKISFNTLPYISVRKTNNHLKNFQ